jgi:hypothetical protein
MRDHRFFVLDENRRDVTTGDQFDFVIVIFITTDSKEISIAVSVEDR